MISSNSVFIPKAEVPAERGTNHELSPQNREGGEPLGRSAGVQTHPRPIASVSGERATASVKGERTEAGHMRGPLAATLRSPRASSPGLTWPRRNGPDPPKKKINGALTEQ